MEQDFIQRLNQLIDQHIENTHFSADDICRAMAISRSQLFRMVKAHTDSSISLYIRKRKLLKAKVLLATTDLKIAEITYRVGIDSPQSFTKYFVQEFGTTPSDFKKNPTQTTEVVSPISTETPTQTIAETHSALDKHLPIDLLEQQQTTPTITPTITTEFIAQPLIATVKKNKRLPRTLLVALGLIMLLGSVFLIKKGIFSTEKAQNTEGGAAASYFEKSIVVMPFQNLGTPETGLFAEGMMDQIHANLAMIEEFRVISKSAAHKEKGKTTAAIATELQVNYILEGKVLQVNKTLQVSLELTHASESRVVWTKTYTVPTAEALRLNQTIVEDIVKELAQKLTLAEQKRIAQLPTTDIETYNLYLQGKLLVQDRVRKDMEAAIVKFDQALVRDPKFVDAYAYKALTYFVAGTMTFMDKDSSVKLAERNALKAIQLDEKNGLAYAVIANIYRTQNKWEQSITTHRIALKHSPNDAQINYWFGITLRSVGQFDKAVEYGKKAVQLDPLHPLYTVGLANSNAYAGRLKEAETILKDAKSLFKNSASYYWATGFYFIFQKDYAAAQREFQGDNHNEKWTDLDSKAMIAFCQAKTGQPDATRQFIASLAPTNTDNCKALSIAYAGLGDTEATLKYLEYCADHQASPDYIKFSPLFTFLHNEPRFQAILDKLGLLHLNLDL